MFYTRGRAGDFAVSPHDNKMQPSQEEMLKASLSDPTMNKIAHCRWPGELHCNVRNRQNISIVNQTVLKKYWQMGKQYSGQMNLWEA